jgi:hypothetical protein
LTFCKNRVSLDAMRSIRTTLPVVLLLLVAVLLVPTSASANTVNWVGDAIACGGWGYSERGSGQLDAQGRLYVPCSVHDNGQHFNHIAVYGPDGRRIQQIPLRFRFPENPNGTDRASAVAPSPDGAHLYVIHYARYAAFRFNRQADGSYEVDPHWRLADYPSRHGGMARALGQFLATDGNGDIYFSSGLWACNVQCTDDAIVKYGPAGNFITRFGRKVGGSWALGDSHGSFAGLAVTADGRRVFVADVNNSRIQRFDRGGDGSYTAVLAMGMTQQTDPNRWGACYGPGLLAGVYDVALSARGELMAINTTCYNNVVQANPCVGRFSAFPCHTIEVQRFGQDGSARGSILSLSRYDTRVHGIAVDRVGNVHLVQAKAVLRPAAGWSDAGADAGGGGPMGGVVAIATPPPVEPQPEPTPQPQPTPTPTPAAPAPANPAPAGPRPAQPGPVVAGGGGGEARVKPRITAIDMPVQLERGRRISMTVRATGPARVTHVRFSTIGRWSTWRPVDRRNHVILPQGLGWKGVLVQVRDASGERSVPWFQTVLMSPRGAQWRRGTAEADNIRTGRGSQHIDASQFDGKVDRISCGPGYDTVLAQREDIVAADCERVIRIRMPAW